MKKALVLQTGFRDSTARETLLSTISSAMVTAAPVLGRDGAHVCLALAKYAATGTLPYRVQCASTMSGTAAGQGTGDVASEGAADKGVVVAMGGWTCGAV
jgi:hypothetical protein